MTCKVAVAVKQDCAFITWPRHVDEQGPGDVICQGRLGSRHLIYTMVATWKMIPLARTRAS